MNLLQWKHGCWVRNGFAPTKSEFGIFEHLESKCLLAADCSVAHTTDFAEHDHADHDHAGGHHAEETIEGGYSQDLICRDDEGAFFLHASPSLSSPVKSALNESDYQHLLPIRVEDVPLYESLPEADRKIYLDFNGHRVSRTGWNEYNGGRTIAAPPFDRDGDPLTFSGAEQRAIELIWARVAEDFAPFEIDVTTKSPSARDFSEGRKAIRVLVSSNVDQLSGERWFENVGGVGYVGSWRFASDTPVWVFGNVLNGHEKRIAEAASHELGHSFGLDHDGTSEDEYFTGFGSGETSWGPIMGSSSGREVTQWSQGEYDSASNSENDLEIIASALNQIEFREDDHASTLFAPTEIETNLQGTFSVPGLISTSFDRDFFVIEMGEGPLEIHARGAEVGSNIDLQLTLYDPEVNILGSFNPRDDLSASIEAELPAGRYFLRVDGVGRGDPKVGGYSEYGSIGTYMLTGSFPSGTQGHEHVPHSTTESSPQRANEVTATIGPFGFSDFLLLTHAYGHDVGSRHESDLNSDRRVDFKDFLIFAKHYGGTP